jgi:hypothetical protein
MFTYGFACGLLLAAGAIAAPRVRETLGGAIRRDMGIASAIEPLSTRIARLEKAVDDLQHGAQGSRAGSDAATSVSAGGHPDEGSSIGISVAPAGREQFVQQYAREFPESLRSIIEGSPEGVVLRILVEDVPLARIEVDQGMGSASKKISVPVKPGQKLLFVNIKGPTAPGEGVRILRLFDRRDKQVAETTLPVEAGQCYGITIRRADK